MYNKTFNGFFSGKMLLAKPSNQNVPSTSPPQASAFFSDLTNCFFLRSDKLLFPQI